MKKLFKILIVGMIAMAFRIGLQLLLPDSGQTVLNPSFLVTTGTFRIAFSILAIVAYSVLAYLFVTMTSNSPENRRWTGLKYSASLSFLWSAYLFEPLPHVSILIDSVAYAIVDSAALLIMGLMLDLLFKKDDAKKIKSGPTMNSTSVTTILINFFIPTFLFLIGRLSLYKFFGIYSYFEERPVITISWCLLIGIIATGVVRSLIQLATSSNKLKHPVLFAFITYILNMTFFNTFVLIVFEFSFVDLSLRTIVDIITIVTGILVSQLIVRKVKEDSQNLS